MSLFGSLNISVMGMLAQSSKLGVVSQNISNVNTVGYKQQVASFADIVAGDNVPGYNPSGVRPGSTSYNRLSGETMRTDNDLDLAILGSGFFAVRPPAIGATASTETLYTRAGHFSQDENGDFVNRNGFFLQGWAMDSNGVTSQTLTNINIAELNEEPSPTSNVDVIANLPSTTTAYSSTTRPYDPTLVTLNSGSMAAGTVAPHFTAPVSVVDANGVSHDLEIGFLKTDVNTWAVEVYARNRTDVSTTNGLLAYGNVEFNGDGTLFSVDPALTAAVSVPWTVVTPPATAAPAANALNFDWGTAGAIFGTPNTVLIGRADGLRQMAIAYENTIRQDGIESSEFKGVRITEEGYVQATYQNGTSRNFFQIPLVNFIEPNRLDSLTGDVFRQSAHSGTANYSTPSRDTALLAVSALEGSNVDTSTELTNLLVAQRAYQFNSKIASTTDNMLESITQMGAN